MSVQTVRKIDQIKLKLNICYMNTSQQEIYIKFITLVQYCLIHIFKITTGLIITRF